MISPIDDSAPGSVVRAVYALISGRAGEPRDWTLLKTLYAPCARLMPVRMVDGNPMFDVLDIEEYERTRTPIFAAADFFEIETGSRVEQFGNVAHVWSAYEARRSQGGEPFMRGINSFQLVQWSSRWRIVSVLWQTEARAPQ